MGFSEVQGELPAPNANAVSLFTVAASASVAASLEEAFLRAPALIAHPWLRVGRALAAVRASGSGCVAPLLFAGSH